MQWCSFGLWPSPEVRLWNRSTGRGGINTLDTAKRAWDVLRALPPLLHFKPAVQPFPATGKADQWLDAPRAQAPGTISHQKARNSPLRLDGTVAQLLDSPAAADQVNHRHNNGDHQQQVDQAAGHMKSPPQKPENNQDSENGPKHWFP